MNDTILGKLLLERGLLTPEEFEDAEAARIESGRPLVGILVEKTYLTPEQVQDALAAINKRVRYCPKCEAPATADRCPECGSDVEWREEAGLARVRDVEELVRLAREDLPEEVQTARKDPDRLFGKYVLLQELGRGGAGVVAKAWDTMLGEFVALKFVRLPSRGSARDRSDKITDFLREARASLRLRHRHIVAVRDVGRIEDQFYIAMDFVAGDTLSDHVKLARARNRISPLYEDPVASLRQLRDVAEAIHYAHTFPNPIVHCDLKPANIMINREGTAYVMDFGLARILGGSREAELDGKVQGTPAYMAPEQAMGRSERIDRRTDVYGLGAVLYELLSGRAVFAGEPLQAMTRAMKGGPDRPVEVAKASASEELTTIRGKISRLESICLKCLEKESANRFPTARHVAEELTAVLEAVESGRDGGILPPRLQQAQERSELQNLDNRLNALNVEEARQAVERLKERRSGSEIRRRLADRRHQVFLLEQFLARMVERLNAERPTLDRFPLEGGRLETAEVLKATPRKVVLYADDAARELAWSALPPGRIVHLAETLKLVEPADRLALGILCRHSGLLEESARFMATLKGTLLESIARDIMDESV